MKIVNTFAGKKVSTEVFNFKWHTEDSFTFDNGRIALLQQSPESKLTRVRIQFPDWDEDAFFHSMEDARAILPRVEFLGINGWDIKVS